MDSALNLLAAQINSIVLGRLAAQQTRVREKWEPPITGSLGTTADECLLEIKKVLVQYRPLSGELTTPAVLQLRLGLNFASILRKNSAQTKGLLQDMVQSEAKALRDIISLNGLVGGQGRQKPSAPAERLAKELAGGVALDRAAQKSQQLFKKRVFASLAEGYGSELDASKLTEQLSAATAWWRSRLQTIAKTILYAAAAQVRISVTESLWQGSIRPFGF
ncbi:MAG: hypothetical protein AB1814_01055 [Thermodesulfobacteriota bacterium]